MLLFICFPINVSQFSCRRQDIPTGSVQWKHNDNKLDRSTRAANTSSELCVNIHVHTHTHKIYLVLLTLLEISYHA